MAARDVFHNVVKIALQKDGWTITDDPLHIRLSGVIDMYIDLGAERVIAAEKAGRKIAVEIKSFLGSSTLSEFYLALGQLIIPLCSMSPKFLKLLKRGRENASQATRANPPLASICA